MLNNKFNLGKYITESQLYKSMFRHGYSTSDRDRALELTQECFLRAFAYADRGEEIREVRPFLFRTLRHLIIDEYRKAKSFSLDSEFTCLSH